MGMAMMGTGTARGDDRAVAAAEAAINNPLLEDVNLAGACGILVNVTAGPNLTMREFDDIGQVIHEFASEDATVVVGTALDPELQDEVRVTVVATGLNRAAARQPMRDATRARAGGRAASADARGAQRDDRRGRLRRHARPADARRARASACRRRAARNAEATISTFRRSCAGRPTDALMFPS